MSPLQSVFTSNISQWAWSITAVAAVEVIAAGAMAAYALEGREPKTRCRSNKSSAASILTGALSQTTGDADCTSAIRPFIDWLGSEFSHESASQQRQNGHGACARKCSASGSDRYR